MNGYVKKVFVNEGQMIQKETSLLIFETMEMQHELCALVPCRVANVYA